MQPSGLQSLTPGLAEYCESERPEYQFAANWPQTFQIASFGSWGVLGAGLGECLPMLTKKDSRRLLEAKKTWENKELGKLFV